MSAKAKPEEVQRVLGELSEEEIKQLRKDNPFRVDRNNKIKELYKRGVKLVVISAITGLSEMSILRAIRNEPNYYKKSLNVDG